MPSLLKYEIDEGQRGLWYFGFKVFIKQEKPKTLFFRFDDYATMQKAVKKFKSFYDFA